MSINLEKLKQTHAYSALLMGMVSLLVCSLLVLSNYLTAEPIAQRQYEDLTQLLDQVLPPSAYDNQPLAKRYQADIDGRSYIFYRARQKDSVSAIVLYTSTPGYSGDISMLIGIRADGNLSGVRVLSHTETPGLGDKIDLKKSNWILSFMGLSLKQPNQKGWAVKKDGGDFDEFTGATITPRAVVKGVHETLQLFEKNKDFFLDKQDVNQGESHE